jgi:Carbohydrate esterase, sialic acid-specific acetylesterase
MIKRTLRPYLLAAFLPAVVDAAPLKVFILAGQSNMQGHANISTIGHMAKDPKTAALHHEMVGKDGNPVTCDKVWISYLSEGRGGNAELREGKLTAGFGARTETIGPEFTFGITMEKQLKEPMLIIKTAWGGKSLHTDFRPPSASADGAGTYYQLMIEHVKKVLEDPKKVVPAYNKRDGHELAGFVWFQGWNDLVDQNTYPKRGERGGYDSYTENMAHFIRDVRKDLNAPKLPFVIGVLGVGGPADTMVPRYKSIYENFRAAQAAPASMPEFKGNVHAVLTEKFWDAELAAIRGKKDLTPEEEEIAKGVSNQEFHYLGAAKILGPIGQAFAEALNKR